MENKTTYWRQYAEKYRLQTTDKTCMRILGNLGVSEEAGVGFTGNGKLVRLYTFSGQALSAVLMHLESTDVKVQRLEN